MLKATVVSSEKGRVVIMDSITKVTPDDAGANVVSASHGGASSGEFALEVPLSSVFFNDAGVGKEGAGIAALATLEARGIAAGTVSHESAKIGDSQDMWDRHQSCQQTRHRAWAPPWAEAEGHSRGFGRCESGTMTLSVRDLSIRFGCIAAVTKMHLDVGKREIIG